VLIDTIFAADEKIWLLLDPRGRYLRRHGRRLAVSSKRE